MAEKDVTSTKTDMRPTYAPVSGDEIARWAAAHADELFRYALPRVGSRDVALDLVQETFLAVAKGAEFSGRSTPKTWLVGVLRNKIADHFRKLAKSPEVKPVNLEGELFNEDGRWRTSPEKMSTDPTDELAKKQFLMTLQECLAKLPGKRAGLFVMRELEGMTTEELCKEFNLSPTNVWVTLHRARLSLRNCLERNGFGRGRKIG